MKMNMKKIISWGMMLAAAFTLTNCAKEIDAPVQEPESVGYPFEIIASTIDTKTVNDGMSTKWAAGDQINVFHALGESENYVDNGAFTVLDVEKGRFTGTLKEQLNVEEEYDWYVLYPYSSYIKTPGAKTDGYTYIGYSSGLNQSGYDSMASLKGSVCPLYGVLKYGGVKPVIEMQHLSSIVAIKVTNDTNQALTINTASFTATEDIVGSYFIDITKTPVEYTAKTAIATATVNVSDGTALAKGESATLYAAIKPFTAAAGQKLTLSVNGYSKEIELSKDVTFTAGKIKTLNFKYDKVAMPEEEVVETFTWDLTKASYSASSASEVKWTSDYADMVLVKGKSSTSANNYLGGTNAHTRVYKDQVLTLTAADAVIIKKVEFNVVSNYMDEFEGATWSNATKSVSGLVMTVIPNDELKPMSVTIGSATRFTSVKVYYKLNPDFVAPTLVSIKVENPKTEYYVGDEFVKPVVKALYDNGNEKDVTSSAKFTGFDSASPVENQSITVTYEGLTTTYKVSILAKEEGVKETKTFLVKSDDVVNNSAYQSYSKTIDGRAWVITCGGNQKSVGVNSSNRSKCNLLNYKKYAVSPITTSSTASAFASTTKLENVSKISYAKLSGGSNQGNTKIYILYSQDGSTFSQISLTSGTQGSTINTSSGGTFEFAECSGYFAVVFVATNSSGNWRLDDVNLTFTYSE